MKNIVFFFCALGTGIVSANAQNAIVKGKVVTTDGRPAESVAVVLKESRKSTISNEDGTFSFKNVKQGKYTVVVSHTGLQTKEQNINIQTSDETLQLDFTLAETAQQLDEVIISGRRSTNIRTVSVGKIPISPMDLPQSVAVIGEGTITNQQAMRLSDVIKNVNGVYLGTTRGSTQEAFYARGYSFGSGNMFKNGFRVNSGAMPEVSSLDRVEILKGSASILYGNVAPGGILNMVTKQPKFETGGEVSMRIGSYSLYKPSFDVYGPINSKIAYRVNGTYENAKSYRDVVKSERYYINPSLLFKLGKRTELLVQGDYLHHNFTPDFGIGSIGDTAIAPLPHNRFLGTNWQYTKTDQSTAGFNLKHQLSDRWTLNVGGSYQSYKRDYYSTERIQIKSNGDWARPINRLNSNEKYYVAQADINGKFKTGKIEHTLLTGIDADRYYTTNYAYDIAGIKSGIYDTINIFDNGKYTARTDMPDATKSKVGHQPTNRFGVYAQDLISLSSKLKVLVGLRWSYQNALAPDTLAYASGKTTVGKDKIDKAFSPRVGIVYKPFSTTSVFASYSNSFVPNTGTDIYGGQLDPSIIDQFEVGIKNDFLKGLLSVNVTAYRIINHNLAQTAQFDSLGNPNSNTNLKQLAGETTSDGIELDVVAHPVKGLDVLAGYSYNNMRYTKTPDAKGNYVEGQRLVNTPANTANGSVFYTFQNKLRGFKVGATVVYIGKRYGGWNDTKQQTQTYSRLIPVDGFTTLDFSAGYTYKKVSLLAKISNVTNALNYYVHENYSINPIPPRQFVATVAYRF
ncbi:TonB-dependent receptor [Danxiaibacter flavus]|uniref:TonB-dependent receptor n=1 Tax=Danxiaibacter flavus TaxID=3049108 RepID=A0ABV3ZGS6_9BACT|nr:TonB-dependent receptor [Chitinophagaceae bacterium DXS]